MYSCSLLVKTSSRVLYACTVSTDRSTLGSTLHSTEEVPVSTEKVRTLFFGAYRTYSRSVVVHAHEYELIIVPTVHASAYQLNPKEIVQCKYTWKCDGIKYHNMK